MSNPGSSAALDGVAIIGMAGRFPGARNIGEFWRNLLAGVESISRFERAELEPSLLEDPGARDKAGYVPVRGVLDGIEMFDAEFFGINPKEAQILDPQQRLFLEAAWEALERAGYEPATTGGTVGVFAGMGNNTYFAANLREHRELIDLVGALQTMMGNEKDYLATRVSYKLDLKGPSVTVQTACSTSLVAICQAVQSLLAYQCDMALAGGVSISLPQKQGYLWQDGGITSRGRPLPRVRRAGRRHRLQQRPRRRRAEAAGRRGGRRRPRLRGHQGIRDQQRRLGEGRVSSRRAWTDTPKRSRWRRRSRASTPGASRTSRRTARAPRSATSWKWRR